MADRAQRVVKLLYDLRRLSLWGDVDPPKMEDVRSTATPSEASRAPKRPWEDVKDEDLPSDDKVQFFLPFSFASD